VHGVDGLAIADASIIPSSIGVNPMETIVALALRCADRWADDLARSRGLRRASRDTDSTLAGNDAAPTPVLPDAGL